MDSKDREYLVETWIEHHKKMRESGKIPGDTFWAYKQLCDLVDNEPELAWNLILQILATDQSDVILENLAAGPLEDFLVSHGKEYIGRVEELARTDSAFNELLGGVWENEINPEVWHRIQNIRKRVW